MLRELRAPTLKLPLHVRLKNYCCHDPGQSADKPRPPRLCYGRRTQSLTDKKLLFHPAVLTSGTPNKLCLVSHLAEREGKRRAWPNVNYRRFCRWDKASSWRKCGAIAVTAHKEINMLLSDQQLKPTDSQECEGGHNVNLPATKMTFFLRSFSLF